MLTQRTSGCHNSDNVVSEDLDWSTMGFFMPPLYYEVVKGGLLTRTLNYGLQILLSFPR
ncbi:MAG: hypothetical protein AB4426_10810 [Xenococcaceae cyanobacterium]